MTTERMWQIFTASSFKRYPLVLRRIVEGEATAYDLVGYGGDVGKVVKNLIDMGLVEVAREETTGRKRQWYRATEEGRRLVNHVE